MEITSTLIYAGIGLLALLVIGLILTRLYQRAPKDAALIRTGFGGEKVIMNGGVIVLPVLHELMHVNLTTVKLKVERVKQDALITADKIRVDVEGLFHIRVSPNTDAVSAAAQTLGKAINDPNAVRDLVEGKLVSALRSVAAKMTMEDLHANRDAFTQQVRDNLKEELAKNGLELETVSLTKFDQTSIDSLNPDNAFDAEGLTAIKTITEDRKKVRNEIEATNRVAIEQRNFEANKRSLEISREDEFNTLAQQQEVETRRAETDSSIAATRAEQEQTAAQAKIEADNATKLRQIEADRQAQEAELLKDRNVELARQETSIATAEKSKAESVATKAANEAKAQAVAAEQGVVTARVVAESERTKRVAVIAATQEAEQQAVRITVAATAEKDAATDRAEAARLVAEGQAQAARIAAQGEADATKVRADAAERQYAVDAEGKRLLNEADNLLSPSQVQFRTRIATLEALPDVVEASVKPMENIDSIRIVQVAGLGGNGGSSEEPAQSGNLADQAVRAAMQYRVQAPLIDSLLKDIGIGDGLGSLVTSAQPTSAAEAAPLAPPPPTAERPSPRSATRPPRRPVEVPVAAE
jgi:flotillin